MYRRNYLLSGAAALGLAFLAGCSDSPTAGSSENADITAQRASAEVGPQQTQMQAQFFVNQATVSGLWEVQSSQLALSRSPNEDVRGFARQMIRDHEQVNNELRHLGLSKGLVVTADLDKGYQQMLTQLNSFSDRRFTQTYIDMQTSAHRQAIALFERASRDVQDSDLRGFAAEMLPMLQQHLNHIEAIGREDASPAGNNGGVLPDDMPKKIEEE